MGIQMQNCEIKRKKPPGTMGRGYKSPEQIGSSNRIGLTQRFFLWSGGFEFIQSLFQSIQRATTPARLFRRLALATASRSLRWRARRQPSEFAVDRATRIPRTIYLPVGSGCRSIFPSKASVSGADGLDTVGRLAAFKLVPMFIDFWTAWTAWTAPILLEERVSIERDTS
jgi:hypothetical protein